MWFISQCKAQCTLTLWVAFLLSLTKELRRGNTCFRTWETYRHVGLPSFQSTLGGKGPDFSLLTEKLPDLATSCHMSSNDAVTNCNCVHIDCGQSEEGPHPSMAPIGSDQRSFDYGGISRQNFSRHFFIFFLFFFTSSNSCFFFFFSIAPWKKMRSHPRVLAM